MKETTNLQPENINEQIQSLPLSKLAVFENHPFQVIQDENFQKLLESVKENGILIPLVARPKGDGYEIVSGHRRKMAAAIAGLDVIPVLVRELTDDQAIVAMVDSNVQRENILPSEKAFAYKMKLEAIKRQGKRSDLTSGQVVQKWSIHTVGEESGENYKQVQRYIRLTELIPSLIKMVDDKKIAFNPAVELSYLPEKQQELLLSAMEAEQSTPSLAQAQKLKTLSADGKLNATAIQEVMTEQKANQKEQVRIPYEKVRSIIKKDLNPKELEDFILKAVTDYQKKLMRQQQNKDAR